MCIQHQSIMEQDRGFKREKFLKLFVAKCVKEQRVASKSLEELIPYDNHYHRTGHGKLERIHMVIVTFLCTTFGSLTFSSEE